MPRLDQLSEMSRKTLLAHPVVDNEGSPWTAPRKPLRDSRLALVTGFDRSGIQRDLNVVFPVDRMRELVGAGELGSLAATFYSFMGAQYPPYGPLQEHAREVGALLRADGVDIVFLTGA
ncbi:MAG: hypothetical protein E6H88_09675 [Chloroflexi bacterium]|nr:MAG: hypothetical protein E6H88_09675 [Chloroflexota bacterium]